MRYLIMAVALPINVFSAQAQLLGYNSYPVYNGNDLGLTYTKQGSQFRIWAPTASEAELLFYKEGIGGAATSNIKMNKSQGGTWLVAVKGDQKGRFYAFRVLIDGKWSLEVPDPYAKSVGVNGKRAMVLDLKETDPKGWASDKSPRFLHPTDAIIYELHVRDASIHPSSGIKNKGKFLGLTERGTKNSAGQSTGLDHLKELGVTHVHLLPVYDYNSIDESRPEKKYNWGYDPLNYNVPEGSYSTDPYDGITRIREFKQLVKSFHENGLRVVMDVVYNHTALTETSNFNQLVPGYYYRQTRDGKFSDASACGNETASERTMMRKFILESMKYWVKEYHIDGFRIDLMGIHDIETMNLVSRELRKIKPGILLYGEGWTAGSSPLPDSLRAIKANAHKLDRIAVFSDDIRDGIKGHVFTDTAKGFVNGKKGMEESIKFGIVASCPHPQVDYSKVNYSKAPYAAQPYHTVTYCECHDNHVLWDKLAITAKRATEEERINMHKLALSIVLTSQGITFLHAGTEFLRSKKGVENSFESPDSINAIDWDLKTKHREIVQYVKSLIRLRKAHPSLRMLSASQIQKNIHFEEAGDGLIIYTVNGAAMKDTWKKIKIIFNGSKEIKRKMIKTDSWSGYIQNNQLNTARGRTIDLKPHSFTILYQE